MARASGRSWVHGVYLSAAVLGTVVTAALLLGLIWRAEAARDRRDRLQVQQIMHTLQRIERSLQLEGVESRSGTEGTGG